MNEWWQLSLSMLGGAVLLWLGLAFFLWREQRRHPDGTSLRHLLRLVPDTARSRKRLAGDRSLPNGVRIWLGVLVVDLLSPIDLIPDFIPIFGYADDAIVVAIALRFATRRAGSTAIEMHWPGKPEGLAALLRLAGLR